MTDIHDILGISRGRAAIPKAAHGYRGPITIHGFNYEAVITNEGGEIWLSIHDGPRVRLAAGEFDLPDFVKGKK